MGAVRLGRDHHPRRDRARERRGRLLVRTSVAVTCCGTLSAVARNRCRPAAQDCRAIALADSYAESNDAITDTVADADTGRHANHNGTTDAQPFAIANAGSDQHADSHTDSDTITASDANTVAGTDPDCHPHTVTVPNAITCTIACADANADARADPATDACSYASAERPHWQCAA
ncbi:MAG: hypothetical protein AB7R89_03560 [Dehalococcoidia bacterium]